MPDAILKPHQWTNGGTEVLVLRFSAKDGTSSSYRLRDGKQANETPFQHPTKVGESVTADDWTAEPVCGGGLHGWPWGLGLGEGKECVWDSLWQVYGVKTEDIVGEIENGQKCKFRTGILRFAGDWHAATMFVLNGQIAWVQQAASGASSATGTSGASSATGDRGASSATGDRGASSATGTSGASSATGYRGASSATGYSGASSATGTRGASSATGTRGASSATGDRGASSATGASSAAIATGLYSRARAGKFGCIALAWWNAKENRSEMRCSLVGQGAGSLKADTWYVLDEKNGSFVEAP